jgi:hypothetical protein
VPTDPFVPADPADRPRQQQNLPPGTALPPAGRWRADRAGDLIGSEQPDGRLFGSPGPNVGYAYTLAEHVADRLQLSDTEDGHDVIPVIAEIAGKRAALFGRAPVIHDVEAVMALLGYDGSADAEFAQARSMLVHEAGHDYRRRRALVDAIPEALLRRKPDEIGAEIYEWRREARERLFPELRRQPTM